MMTFLRLFVAFFLIPWLYAAPLRLEINQGKVEPEPISIPSFGDDGSGVGEEIADIIKNDLKNSGLFTIILQNDQSQESLLDEGPRYSAWSKSRYLVSGHVTQDGDHVSIRFRVYDVLLKRELEGSSVSGPLRKASHKVADKIYERITGEAGFFCTRFLFVESTHHGRKTFKRLVLVDQDGVNRKELVANRDKLVVMAKAAPDGSIAYLALEKNKVRLYHKKQIISEPRDKHYSFSFLNNEQLIMSSAKKGTSAIYLMDLESREKRLITQHRAIHTSPSPSPDGSKILYTSDEQGRESIFVMGVHGQGQRKISSGKGKYSQPAWSPRSDNIAFVKQIGGTFYLGVMSPDGNGERLIHTGYLIERPCFAENGRYIAFIEGQRSGRSRVCMIDITGNPLSYRCVKTNGNACDVAWIGSKKKEHS